MEQLNSILQQIKKDFFAFRNGIVADALRKVYTSDVKIYGLMAPQLMEISNKYPKNLEVGLKLWDDKSCRESRMLALYFIPPQEISLNQALKLAQEVRSEEEAEFLAFKVLRNIPEAYELLNQLRNMEITQSMPTYCVQMLQKNLERL